jgi:hypothetical protein
VRIDGVRYVPAVQAAPGVQDVMNALSSVFWGYPNTDTSGLQIIVTDSGEHDGESFDEFAETLASVLRNKR